MNNNRGRMERTLQQVVKLLGDSNLIDNFRANSIRFQENRDFMQTSLFSL